MPARLLRLLLCSVALLLPSLPLSAQTSSAVTGLEQLRSEAESRMLAIPRALDARYESLAVIVGDYARWDDTYRFAVGTRPVFPGAGLLAPALSQLGIQRMLVLNREFDPLLSLSISASPLQQTPVPADSALVDALRRAVQSGSLALREDRWRGWSSLDGQLALVVAGPIVRVGTTSASAPAGWLAFAQAVDTAGPGEWLRNALPDAVEVSVNELPVTPETTGLRNWLQSPSRDARFYSETGASVVTTWFALRDLAGRPVWLAKLDTPIPTALQPSPGGAGGNWVLGGTLALLAAAFAVWGIRKRNGQRQSNRQGMSRTDAVPPPASLAMPPVAGVAEQELALFYEPIVDLRSERLWGLAARLRWNEHAKGWIQPDDHLQVIGHAGESLASARFVLQRVARDIHRWRAAGAKLVPVSVECHVSASCFDEVVKALKHVRNEWQVEPELLQVEIAAASVLDSRTGRIYADVVTLWRRLGLWIVVHRWGARGGVQPVPMLEGVDALKLDGRLVREIEIVPAARDSLRALMTQANSRDLPVIAEGVDRWQQIDRLREAGCHLAQGSLLSNALPAEQIEGLLHDGRFEMGRPDELSNTDELPQLE